MTEVSIRPGTGRHSETTERTNEIREGSGTDGEGPRDRKRERRTVEPCVHTSDVSERMRPSQSDVRREYKSRRVIHSSVCWLQQCAAVAHILYAHARDCGWARRRTRPLSVEDRNDLSHVLVFCLSVPPFVRRPFVPPRSAFFLPPCSLPCSSSSLLRTQASPSSPPDSYKKESCKE